MNKAIELKIDAIITIITIIGRAIAIRRFFRNKVIKG